MSFAVSHTHNSATITVTPIAGQQYYYRIYLRTGMCGGTGTLIYDQQRDEGMLQTTTPYSRTVSGLSPQTVYAVNVAYYSGSNPSTDYVGSMGCDDFETDPPPSNARIYTDGAWKTATPYIYTGGSWQPASGHIYTGGAWKG